MNPYYLAWLRFGGMCQPLYKFMFFIQDKHREYKKIYGIPANAPFYSFNDKEFIEFINIGPNKKQNN